MRRDLLLLLGSLLFFCACSGSSGVAETPPDEGAESDLTGSRFVSGTYDGWMKAKAHDYGDQSGLVDSAHQGFNPVSGDLGADVAVAKYTYKARLEDVADLTITTKAFRPLVLVTGGSCAKPIRLLGVWKKDHYEVEKDISDLRCSTADRWTVTILVTSTKNAEAGKAVSSGAFTWQYDNLE